MIRRVAVRKAVGIDHTDILCDVANGAVGSTPASGRLTDHLAIGVLTGLIHRDIIDDVIPRVRETREAVTATACARSDGLRVGVEPVLR